MGDGFARILGRPGQLERLGSVEGGREADFAGLFGMGLGSVGVRRIFGEGRGPGGFLTPLRADLAARLALALCLPPMGAVGDRVSIQCTRSRYCVQNAMCGSFVLLAFSRTFSIEGGTV